LKKPPATKPARPQLALAAACCRPGLLAVVFAPVLIVSCKTPAALG